MSETPDERYAREMREFEGQNIQDYSVRLTAWFATKLEKDKSLLTISSAAVGLLVTILVSKGIQSFYQIFIFAIAFLSFLVTIIAVIQIFDKNAEQIEANITSKSHINVTLTWYERVIACSFYTGLLFTIILGITYGYNIFVHEKESKTMADKKAAPLDHPTKPSVTNENYSGSERLAPKKPSSPAAPTPKAGTTKKVT